MQQAATNDFQEFELVRILGQGGNAIVVDALEKETK